MLLVALPLVIDIKVFECVPQRFFCCTFSAMCVSFTGLFITYQVSRHISQCFTLLMSLTSSFISLSPSTVSISSCEHPLRCNWGAAQRHLRRGRRSRQLPASDITSFTQSPVFFFFPCPCGDASWTVAVFITVLVQRSSSSSSSSSSSFSLGHMILWREKWLLQTAQLILRLPYNSPSPECNVDCV